MKFHVLVALGLAALLLARAPAADAQPTLPPDLSYSDARRVLLEDGWRPLRLEEADDCARLDIRCRRFPEAVSCSGTGEGPCLFAWSRGDVVLEIITAGEKPRVRGARCRSGCPR